LLSNSELAGALADAGAQTARTRFTLEACVANINRIIEAAAAKSE
jgi:hypothetical protein